jgi:lipopolysaccharide transport system permease protein
VLFLPVYTFVLALFAIGLAWVVSSLHVYIRDTAQVVSVLLTFWFWFTPIFMWEDKIPEKFRFLLAWNPLAYIVRAYRERLLSVRLPDLRELAIVGLCALGMFVAGGLFFRHLKRGFADVL